MSEPIPSESAAKPAPAASRVSFRQILPNLVTILSICAGVTGIRFAFEGRFELAVGLVLGAAFLDVTDPEPLPPEHPLWTRDNVQISMHLSGRSQQTIVQKGAERFLANLPRFSAGEPLAHEVDLSAGY